MQKFRAFAATGADITIIVSLIIALLSYLSQIDQSKKNASFEVLSRLNTGEALSAQRRIATELARADIKQFKGLVVPRSTMAVFVGQLASTSADEKAFDQDVFTLVSYFDDAQVCVETGTCDSKILAAHLGESATRYACLLLPYVFGKRDDYLLEGLGDRMATMVDYENSC